MKKKICISLSVLESFSPKDFGLSEDCADEILEAKGIEFAVKFMKANIEEDTPYIVNDIAVEVIEVL